LPSSRTRRPRFDDDDESYTPDLIDAATRLAATSPDQDTVDDVNWSNYADSWRGPQPAPEWVITSAAAVDDDLGVLKTGKEADVSLVRRTLGEQSVLMAAKRYRSSEHRLFHRDAGYLEGRRVRKSREMRAMRTRTSYGRNLIAGQWAAAEFSILARLWTAGAAVPYPVQFDGDRLLMEFIGHDGVAAPRLAALRPEADELRNLYQQLRTALTRLADEGLTHGDLSPYNVLVHDGRLVLIDVPQAVDIVGNPQGFTFLRRDCENICSWFIARGLDVDPVGLEAVLLESVPGM
jgi:RIO kinase 1